MQQEIVSILEVAAAEDAGTAELAPIRLVTVTLPGRTTWARDEIYGDDEGR